ncbi:MAG: hypothetical protein ABUK01_10085 [Leptospirales bacterium]
MNKPFTTIISLCAVTCFFIAGNAYSKTNTKVKPKNKLESVLFDQSEIEVNKIYRVKFDEEMISRTFKNITKPVNQSNLKYSKASYKKVPREIESAIDKVLYEVIYPDKYENVKITHCVEIEYEHFFLFVISERLIPKDAQRPKEIDELILIISLEKEEYKDRVNFPGSATYGNKHNELQAIYFLSSKDRRSDSSVYYKLRGISDVDEDGNHEIIIDDIRYAGRSILIIKNYLDTILKVEIPGDSWD